jgi:hypothetical protein
MSKLFHKLKVEFFKLLLPRIFLFIAVHAVALIRALTMKGTGISPLSSMSVAVAGNSKIRTLSATVVPMKSPDEGGVDESLRSGIRGLLPTRCAQMPERRTAVFCNFMLREVKSAALRDR